MEQHRLKIINIEREGRVKEEKKAFKTFLLL